MAVTYNWKVSTCDYDVATGGISHVHWQCSASENDVSQTVVGVAKLEPDATSSDFVSYADVTETTALGWVWGKVSKDKTETQLAAKVVEKKTPTESTGMPWAAE